MRIRRLLSRYSGSGAGETRQACLGGAVAVMLAAVVVAACGSSASPLPTSSPTSSPTPGLSPTASPTVSPSPSPTTTPATSALPADIVTVTGKAALLAPAGDQGRAAARQINDFAFDLLRHLDASGNLVASPTSIALSVAMVTPGARGATAAEIDQVLHSFGSNGQGAEIVALLRSLQSKSTATKPAIDLEVSNGAFAQRGMTLEEAYLDALSSSFGAGLGTLDFRADPEGARLAINKWASDRTHGRIPAVLQPGDVTDLTRIALANAIYLKAGWTHPFDPAMTGPLPFKNAAGHSISVPTMQIMKGFKYGTGSGYRAIELPYGQDETLSMMIVVPNDMSSFVAGLSASKLDAIVGGEQDRVVVLTLPKFSAETRVDLAETLAAMGMPTVFDRYLADLSGITRDEQLHVTHVIHQANIDVYESGTTAAAVTVTTGEAMAAPGMVEFHVDRPFLYLIRDTASGAVLFMGRIDDPSR
jgi:serpin B